MSTISAFAAAAAAAEAATVAWSASPAIRSRYRGDFAAFVADAARAARAGTLTPDGIKIASAACQPQHDEVTP
ncbi:MAG: hypothetical protein ACK5XU_17655 [Pseudomonadota bacterium]